MDFLLKLFIHHLRLSYYGMEAQALADLMENFRIRYSCPRLVLREELSAWN